MPSQPTLDVEANRPVIIPKEPFLSREFLELEKKNLWPKTWLMVCRADEVAKNGRFVTFTIADESIIVVRGADDGVLRAFYNVCQHRGRRLMSVDSGQAKRFICKYHGWRWTTDGKNEEVIDSADWNSTLCEHDVKLKDIKVDTWGGWVFINMDPDSVSLQEYFKPVEGAFANYKLEEFSPDWWRTVTLPCNWKVALDVFIEAYHAQTAHRQFNRVSGDNRWFCQLHGLHSMFHFRGIPILGDPSPNYELLPGLEEDDELFRNAKARAERIYTYFDMLRRDTGALISERKVRSTKRLAKELPKDAEYMEILMAMDRLHREEGKNDGISWDQFTMEDLGKLGMDWHLFPNIAFLPTEDAALCYRARPNGDDPDSCIFDIWSMERYAPGTAPEVKQEIVKDWRDVKWPRVFVQDFENLGEIQAGMKSRGFAGGLANPLAETTCIHFADNVRRYAYGKTD